MNKYTVDLKGTYKREVEVDAETPQKALDLIEKIFINTDLFNEKNEHLYELVAKVIKENGEKIEGVLEDLEEDFDEEINEKNVNLDDVYDEVIGVKRLLENIQTNQKIIFNGNNLLTESINKLANLLDDINEFVIKLLNQYDEENE